MGTYGTTAIKGNDKTVFITDSHDSYFSGMGRNNFVSAAISPPTNILKQLLANFNNESKEWVNPTERQREAIIHQYEKDGGSNKELFKKYLTNELRPSIGGFLPTLYVGAHTGYSDSISHADYLVDLDKEEISYIRECYQDENDKTVFVPYFTISMEKLRAAGAKRANFFGEYFEELLENTNESVDSIVKSKLKLMDDQGNINDQSNQAYIQGDSVFDLIEDAEEDKKAILKIQNDLQKKIEDFLSLEESVIEEVAKKESLYHEKMIAEMEKRHKAFEKEILKSNEVTSSEELPNLNVTTNQETNTNFYSVFSGEVTFDQQLLFIYLFQNLVLTNPEIDPEVARRKVSWSIEGEHDTSNPIYRVYIKADQEDPNLVLKGFADTLWYGLGFKLNIISSTGGIGLFDSTTEQEEEELPTLVSKEEFSNYSTQHWGALNDNLPNVALYIPYAEMRETILNEEYKAPGTFLYKPMLQFSILNRDIETANKLLVVLKEDFESLPKDQNIEAIEKGITKFIMGAISQSKNVDELTDQIGNAQYQSNFEDFIFGISKNLSFIEKNMLDFEKESYLNKGQTGSKNKPR